MPTFLFDNVVFGPVSSRRLGISLGINLLPDDAKICNFDCIYCECGWTHRKKMKNAEFHGREEIFEALEKKLSQMKASAEKIDTITFAGNGEPTIHPKFAEIIDDTIGLKNKYFPTGKIAVLSNATMLHKKKVFDALLKIEYNILKIDSAFETTIKVLDNPLGNYSLKKVISHIKKFPRNVTIQTMFVRGSFENNYVDNTTEIEICAWLEIIKDIKPKMVMIYTIARDTPINTLQKIHKTKLDAIADKVNKLGIETQVSA